MNDSPAKRGAAHPRRLETAAATTQSGPSATDPACEGRLRVLVAATFSRQEPFCSRIIHSSACPSSNRLRSRSSSSAFRRARRCSRPEGACSPNIGGWGASGRGALPAWGSAGMNSAHKPERAADRCRLGAEFIRAHAPAATGLEAEFIRAHSATRDAAPPKLGAGGRQAAGRCLPGERGNEFRS